MKGESIARVRWQQKVRERNSAAARYDEWLERCERVRSAMRGQNEYRKPGPAVLVPFSVPDRPDPVTKPWFKWFGSGKV